MFVHEVVSLAFRLHVLSAAALAASLPAHISSPDATGSLSAPPASTFPINLTLLHPSSNALPRDPTIYKLPLSHLLINFHAYGPRLPRQLTYRTLQKGVEDVLLHVAHDPREGKIPMQRRPAGYHYGAGTVRLALGLQAGMTWGVWGDALTGLRLFGEAWEFVALEFEILDRDEEETCLGNGRFWEVG